MTALAHFFWIAFQWRFAMMWIVVPGATLVPFAVVFFLGGPALRWLRVALIATLVGTFALMLAMMTLGPWIVSRLIYTTGVPGTGVITKSEQTGDMYNSQYVMRLSALLKTRASQLTETSFRDTDFNIWPANDATRYPGVGQQFNTRYLPGRPQEFVIVADDDSEFARSLRCGALKDAVSAARKGSEFAGNDPSFQRRLAAATQAEATGGCSVPIRTASGRIDPANPARTTSRPASSVAGLCAALMHAMTTVLETALKQPHDLTLRRKYFETVQGVNDAGCPHQSAFDYPH